jgi:hypothetical protein
MEGLPSYYGSLFSEHVDEELDLSGIGRLLALTPSEEINALAALHFSEVFGRNEVYQLPSEAAVGTPEMSIELRGRNLFNPNATYVHLAKRLGESAEVKKTKLTEEFDYNAFLEQYGEDPLILFLIDTGGGLVPITANQKLDPKPGETLIFLPGSGSPMEEHALSAS